MSEPYEWFAPEGVRELRRRRLQALGRTGFYLLTAVAVIVVAMALGLK